jgi:hypothetical protein
MSIGQRFYDRTNLGNVYVQRVGKPCVLYEVTAQNLSGADLWLMVFNAAILPTAGDPPDYSFKVVDGQSIAIAPPAGPNDTGRPFPLGYIATWNTTAIYAPELGPFAESMIYVAGRLTA